jgi:hypothetical protein
VANRHRLGGFTSPVSTPASTTTATSMEHTLQVRSRFLCLLKYMLPIELQYSKENVFPRPLIPRERPNNQARTDDFLGKALGKDL